MNPVLTKEIHTLLKTEGYQYMLLKDVAIDPVTQKISTLTVDPARSIPVFLSHSCMGIDDSMLLDLLSNHTGVTIYISKPLTIPGKPKLVADDQ